MDTGISIILILVWNIAVVVMYELKLKRIIKSMQVGTLRIIDDGEEPQPYLFVELDESPYMLLDKEYVMMKVEPKQYSQE